MINWHLEKRLIKDLKPNPKNPRELSRDQERQLSASLDKFGLADKPIINTDGMIIGGHMRVRILKGKKHKEIDVLVPDRSLTEEEVDEFTIRLNQNHGSWDWDVLGNEWNLPDLVNWGFDPNELDISSFDDVKQEKAQKGKKLKMCPQCGHEF